MRERLELGRFTWWSVGASALGCAGVVVSTFVTSSSGVVSSPSATTTTTTTTTTAATISASTTIPATASTSTVMATTTMTVPAPSASVLVATVRVVGDGSIPSVDRPDSVTELVAPGAGFVAVGADGRTLADLIEVDRPTGLGALVLVGGAGDLAAVPAEELLADLLGYSDAVLRTLSAALVEAAGAPVVLIGPVVETGDPAALAAVRDVLRTSAGALGVQFRDPISERWVPAGGRSLDGTLTELGRRAVASEYAKLLGGLAGC